MFIDQFISHKVGSEMNFFFKFFAEFHINIV